MDIFIYNESYAAVVGFMLLFDCLLVRRLSKTPGFSSVKTWIVMLMAAAVVCTVTDALCILLGARAGRVGAYLLNAAFTMAAEFIALLMFVYCELIYDAERIMKPAVKLAIAIPVTILAILLITSWHTGWLFSIDELGNYHRGPMYVLYVFVLANGFVISAIVDFSLRLRTERDPKKRRILKESLVYFIPLVVGTLCQFFYTALPTSNIGLTISILLIFMDNQERLLVNARDELKEKQLELEKAVVRAESANKAKTDFLQRMSHDIRTPINAICGMVEIADRYPEDLERQSECRRKIKDASHLLLELVNEILDLGKLESGEFVIEEVPFKLEDTVREIYNVIEKQAVERNIKVSSDSTGVKHWRLIGSQRHVKRLIMNIMTNAVKYNKDGGEIHLTARELGTDDEGRVLLQFTCRDTGIGMTPEFQKHIFEPFTQENGGSRTNYGGTGLGMPIAKSLAEKLGGSLEFESTAGVGTTFVITLPFMVDASGEEKRNTEAAAKASIRGLKLLLAEDNELNMEIAEFIILDEGAEAVKARDGAEALRIFTASEPGEFDAILMDIMMPVMDGYECTRHIRELDRADARTVPVIAMTANAFTEDKVKARGAGMNAHVSKPISREMLVQTIAEAVGEAHRS